MYLISDNIDTLTGMRLAGVEGVVVHGRKELITALNEASAIKETAIILITNKLSALAPEHISNLKLNQIHPLIVEIPDRHGEDKPSDYITRHIRDAIGLKL